MTVYMKFFMGNPMKNKNKPLPFAKLQTEMDYYEIWEHTTHICNLEPTKTEIIKVYCETCDKYIFEFA